MNEQRIEHALLENILSVNYIYKPINDRNISRLQSLFIVYV